MRVVNKRFEIVNKVKSLNGISEYNVMDIETQKIYILDIFSNDVLNEKTKNYLINNFQSIKNFNYSGIYSIYDLIRIKDIDGINLEKIQYGVISEFEEELLNLKDFILQAPEEKIIDVILDFMAKLNTLNIKGFVYSDLVLEDIGIIYKDGREPIKLPNIIISEFSKLDNVFIRYNDINNVGNKNIFSDKSSNVQEAIGIIEEVIEIVEKNGLNEKLREVKNIIEGIEKNKIINLNNLIELFRGRYFIKKEKFLFSNIQKIEENIDIVGRDVEIENVMEIFSNILESKISSKTIMFTGGMGVGKSTLLNQIKKRLEYKHSTSIFSIRNFENEIAFRSNTCAKEFSYNKAFRKEFRKFMDDFSKRLRKGYNVSSTTDIKEIYKLLNHGLKLIDEHSRITPMILIIDDLDKKNKVCRMFLKHLIENINSIENTLIIVSVDKNIENEDFKKYYEKILENEHVKEYSLGMLNRFYTGEMIAKVLNTISNTNEINEIIYSDTLGNPGLIMKKIKDMYNCKSIYVSKNGHWKYKKVRFFFNSISYLEEKYIDKIETLNFFEYAVLKKLATYNFIINEEIFLENVILTLKEKEAYFELKKQKIITETYDDTGINIDFKDHFYKKIIYKRMPKNQKQNEHLRFVKLLEKLCENDIKYYSEFIYHLEMSRNYDKMIIYTKKYTVKLMEMGEMEKAIDAYKRILEYIKDGEKLEISYEIGSIYEKMEVDLEALRFYKIANENAVILKNYSYVIEISLNMARIHIENENYLEAFEHMGIAKTNLLKTDYKLGYAKYFLIKALYLKYIGNKEEAIEFANKALAIGLKENFVGIIGEIYLILFEYEVYSENYEAAEKSVSYCEKIFKKGKSGKKYYETLINKATLKIERDKKIIEGKKILKHILKESIEKNMSIIKYYTLIQLANTHLFIDEIEKCKKYLLEILDIIKTNKGLKRYLNSTYEYLIYISAINKNFREVIKYKNAIIKNKDRKEEKVKSFMYVLYYYALEDYTKVKETIVENKLENKIIKNKGRLNIDLNFFNIIYLDNEKDVKEEFKYIDETLKKYYSKRVYNNKMIELIILLNKLGYKDFSKTVFDEKRQTLDFTVVNERAYLCLINKFRIYSPNILINRGLRIVNTMPNRISKLEMFYLIAQNYEKTKRYALAFEHYYEGVIILSNYIKEERLEDRRKILQSGIFYIFLERFLYCANEKLNMGIQVNTFMHTELEIESFLEQVKVNKMIKNKKFKKVIMNKYEKTYLNNYKNADDVLSDFKEDIMYNIQILMKFIIRETLSTSAVLILKNEFKDIIIYSYRTNYMEIKRKFLNQKINADFFIVDNEEINQNEIYEQIIPQNIKSCLYKKLKRKYGEGNSYKNIEGQLILMSDKLINNINYEAYEKIMKYENILTFLLDQYKIIISSTRDKLTGAFNRAYFEKTMENIIRDFNYEEKIFSIIIFDIDNFKGINDKFGHQTGDMVLEKISEVIKECIENKDIFSRYGGEEFIIICPNEDEKRAYEKADMLRKKIQDENILRGRREVTISMGVATYPIHSKKKDDLIKKADQALYEAKRGTKNAVKIWNDEFETRVESTDKLAGIITGSSAVDYERISSIVEVLEISINDMGRAFKLYKILRKISKIINSRECLTFKIEDGNPILEMSMGEDLKGWKNNIAYNNNLIEKVIKTKQGIYTIDWDEISHDINIIPKWNSVCIVPIIKENEIKGIIYMATPIKRKEFDFKDYNYLNNICNILSILF